MENPGGIIPQPKTIDQMLNEGGSWNSSGQFVQADGTIRQDLPNRGDYEHGKGVPITGYYEDGTAAIKKDGQWYPAYDAPKRKQNVQEDVVETIKDYAQTSQKESYEFTMDYLAGQQAAAKEKNDRLGDYMPGEKYWPYTEEAEVKDYNGESFGYKLGYYSELSKELGDMIREGMGYNAAYKVPKISGSVEGPSKSGGEWSQATFQSEKLLNRHIDDHLHEFNGITKVQYVQKARDLLNSNIGGDIEGFTNNLGWTFRYNKASNEFAIGSPQGLLWSSKIVTLMAKKPTN